MPYDDRLIEQGINAGIAYHVRGGRLHGADIAPAVSHVGHKMAQVGKYAQLAHAGFRLGKRVFQSFSQKEKMPPIRNNPYPTPRRTPKKALKLQISKKGPMRITLKGDKGTQAKFTKRKVRVMSARNSSFGGKIYRGKKRISPKARFERLGTAINYEYSTVYDTAGNQTAVIAHSNLPGYHVTRSIVGTILKALFKKVGWFVTSWSDKVQGLLQANDEIVLAFHRATGGLETISYSIVAADVLLDFDNLVTQVLTLCFAEIFTVLVSNPNLLATNNVAFQEISYNPTATNNFTRAKLSLANVKFSLYLKSDLKMQNRSITVETNNEADDVDNVPIYGKAYDAKGTGVRLKQPRLYLAAVPQDNAPPNFNLNVGLQNGVRLLAGGTNTGTLEPWQRKQFYDCTREQNVGLAPGEIKTSQIIDVVKVSLDYIMKSTYQLSDTNTGGLFEAFPKIRVGRVRMFIFERVIGVVGFTGVKIAMEHNGYVASIMHPATNVYTTPYFTTIA